MGKNGSKKYEERIRVSILSEKAEGFFADLNKFKDDKNLLNFKKDISDQLVMSGQEISNDVASFLAFTISSRRPKKILELGTFAGFSTLVMARACPDDHFSITTVDVNLEPALVGQKYWEKEGYEKNIIFKQGRASEVLENLEHGFDFIFIDADKKGTWSYLEKCLSILSKDGLIVVDNIWLSGAVLDPEREMHFSRIDFLKQVEGLVGVNKTYLPIGDGLLLLSLR